VEAVIFVGLPGAGKSTFYRERFFASHLRIKPGRKGTGRKGDAAHFLLPSVRCSVSIQGCHELLGKPLAALSTTFSTAL
jgi:hypothetical protein